MYCIKNRKMATIDYVVDIDVVIKATFTGEVTLPPCWKISLSGSRINTPSAAASGSAHSTKFVFGFATQLGVLGSYRNPNVLANV